MVLRASCTGEEFWGKENESEQGIEREAHRGRAWCRTCPRTLQGVHSNDVWHQSMQGNDGDTRASRVSTDLLSWRTGTLTVPLALCTPSHSHRPPVL